MPYQCPIEQIGRVVDRDSGKVFECRGSEEVGGVYSDDGRVGVEAGDDGVEVGWCGGGHDGQSADLCTGS